MSGAMPSNSVLILKGHEFVWKPPCILQENICISEAT